MSGSTHISVAAPGAGPLLPPELRWFYVLAPLPTTLLLVNDPLALPLNEVFSQIVGNYVPFISLSLVFDLLYRLTMPQLLRPFSSTWARGLVHLSVVTAVAVPVSGLIRPIHQLFCERSVPGYHFAVVCVLMSYAMIFPALLFQGARVRANTIAQLAMAERQATLRAQLEALQARTNPHFFFNSINTVAALIPEDPQLAERTLERLADLFRYALDSSKTPLVSLQREFDMVREYLAIESARFGDRLTVKVTLDPAAATLQVPPLLLQPLVENAVLHGLAKRECGRVEVEGRREGDRILIDVRDDGPGPGASVHRGTQTSVKDIVSRLRLTFGDAGGFALEDAPGGGCLARLALPCP